VLAGTEPYQIASKARLMFHNESNWGNPFGDGKAGTRIVDITEGEVWPNQVRKY
jgi:UDP-N-acetylglucosamine 2-epimerase